MKNLLVYGLACGAAYAVGLLAATATLLFLGSIADAGPLTSCGAVGSATATFALVVIAIEMRRRGLWPTNPPTRAFTISVLFMATFVGLLFALTVFDARRRASLALQVTVPAEICGSAENPRTSDVPCTFRAHIFPSNQRGLMFAFGASENVRGKCMLLDESLIEWGSEIATSEPMSTFPDADCAASFGDNNIEGLSPRRW